MYYLTIVRKIKFILISVFIVILCLPNNGCRNDNANLQLLRGEIREKWQVDTVESFPEKQRWLVGITINRPFGKFDYFLAIIKKTDNAGLLMYRIEDNKNASRVSKDYIAIVSPYPHSHWGWFYLKNGKIQNDVPNARKILDSIKLKSSKKLFVREDNGYFSFFDNGKTIKTLNYGNFITKERTLDFDSLPYRLYKLSFDSLLVVSNTGNDLLKERDGIFFVPSPGYGVIGKFKKTEIYNIIDSVAKLQQVPPIIEVKADD